jgi:hypothetical protein
MIVETLIDLALEFEADAEMLERIAKDYLAKGMSEQYAILWHEGAVYRCCADRLREVEVSQRKANKET